MITKHVTLIIIKKFHKDNCNCLCVVQSSHRKIYTIKHYWSLDRGRKRTISDSVPWRKPLYKQKIQQPIDNTKAAPKTSITQQSRTDWKLVRTSINVYFTAFKIIFLSLCSYYLGWISCLISFERCQSICEEHGTSKHYKKSCPR